MERHAVGASGFKTEIAIPKVHFKTYYGWVSDQLLKLIYIPYNYYLRVTCEYTRRTYCKVSFNLIWFKTIFKRNFKMRTSTFWFIHRLRQFILWMKKSMLLEKQRRSLLQIDFGTACKAKCLNFQCLFSLVHLYHRENLLRKRWQHTNLWQW